MADPITPPVAQPPAPKPVPADVIKDEVVPALNGVQKLVRADKTAVVAGLIHVAILMVAALGMHLSAENTAILGSIVTAGVSYFLGMHFKKS